MADVTPSLFDWTGGGDSFRRLIDAFYDRVEHDELISVFSWPPPRQSRPLAAPTRAASAHRRRATESSTAASPSTARRT